MSTKQKRRISNRKLAERITRTLFTNGIGKPAERLVLEMPDGRDGGGWCFEAVVGQVKAILDIELKQRKSP